MPSKSPAQHRLMEAAAHTKGGFGGVPQKVGKEFVKADKGKEFKKGGLYANIHAKQQRIAEGSGEKMRRVGSKGAPTAEAFKQSARTVKKAGGGSMASATDMSRLRKLEEDQRENDQLSTKLKAYATGAMNAVPFLNQSGISYPGPKEYESKRQQLREAIASERESVDKGERDYSYKSGNKLPEGMVEKKSSGGKAKKTRW
jgi:hypothetical protein